MTVPTPTVKAMVGTLERSPSKNLALARMVSMARVFTRVLDTKLDPGSLKAMWPSGPIPGTGTGTAEAQLGEGAQPAALPGGEGQAVLLGTQKKPCNSPAPAQVCVWQEQDPPQEPPDNSLIALGQQQSKGGGRTSWQSDGKSLCGKSYTQQFPVATDN